MRSVAICFAIALAYLMLTGQILGFSKGVDKKVEPALIRDGVSLRRKRLAPWLDVWCGYVNIGVVRRGERVLLVGGAPPELLGEAGISSSDIDMVLLTHCHRDAAEGAVGLAASGMKVVVPVLERQLFEEPEKFWNNDGFRFHAYNYHPSRRTVRQAVKVSRVVRGGDMIEWHGLNVKALDAPGPTDGGVSYLVTDGMVSVAFVGDLISGYGQLWEIHSLQGTRPLPNGGRLMEYHGFLERADEVLSSLEAVLAESPQYLVPLHGAVIDKPVEAVGGLRRRLSAVIESYCKTSSGRWYFAGARPEWPLDRSDMEARLRPLPEWVREIGGTSRALVADD
ncbi:MAG: MBL fold metallo-hydrolase, partial [Armatimonadota bacterium]